MPSFIEYDKNNVDTRDWRNPFIVYKRILSRVPNKEKSLTLLRCFLHKTSTGEDHASPAVAEESVLNCLADQPLVNKHPVASLASVAKGALGDLLTNY
jgi:hypothetical protein